MKTMDDKHQDQSTGKAASSLPLPTSKRGFKGFWQETMAEFKKVHWPKRSETNRLTGVVIVICLGSVLLLYGLSTAFGEIMHILLKG
ncbi:MAG: preprotein translocase subunit SecE [Chthonomonas sp.]|nr:preprotein translocase subunit SecE [Chthonomonas sp.]